MGFQTQTDAGSSREPASVCVYKQDDGKRSVVFLARLVCECLALSRRDEKHLHIAGFISLR